LPLSFLFVKKKCFPAFLAEVLEQIIDLKNNGRLYVYIKPKNFYFSLDIGF